MRDFVSTSSGTTLVKARRAHSMPSSYGNNFVLPSRDMGEYDEVGGGASRRRSAPERGGQQHHHAMLYPLREEGTYGAPPAAPAPPKEYVRRERKPKVYSSYSVNTECSVHGGEKLARSERDHGAENISRRASVASRRASSSSGGSRRPSWASRASPAPQAAGGAQQTRRRTVSASPSRRTSASPEPAHVAANGSRKYSGGGGGRTNAG